MNNRLTRSHEDLNAAWRNLQQMWHALRGEWDDDRARRFERESWPPFEAATPAVLREIDALKQLIHKAQREVE